MSEQPIYVPALDTDGKIPLGFLPDDIGGLTPEQAETISAVPLISAGRRIIPQDKGFDPNASLAAQSAVMGQIAQDAGRGDTLLLPSLAAGKTYGHGVGGVTTFTGAHGLTVEPHPDADPDNPPILRAPASAVNTSPILLDRCDDVRLHGFRTEVDVSSAVRGDDFNVHGNLALKYCNRPTVEHVHAKGAKTLAIAFYACPGVTGRFLTWEGSLADGLNLWDDCPGFLLEDCGGSAADDGTAIWSTIGHARPSGVVRRLAITGSTDARGLMLGGVEGVEVYASSAANTRMAGLAVILELQSTSGELNPTEGVTIESFTLTSCGNDPGTDPDDERGPDNAFRISTNKPGAPSIIDVRARDIVVINPAPAVPPIGIKADPGADLDDIDIDRVTVPAAWNGDLVQPWAGNDLVHRYSVRGAEKPNGDTVANEGELPVPGATTRDIIAQAIGIEPVESTTYTIPPGATDGWNAVYNDPGPTFSWRSDIARDRVVELTLKAASAGYGMVIARSTDGNHYLNWRSRNGGTSLLLERWDHAVEGWEVTGLPGFSAGDMLRAVLIGDTLVLLRNGAVDWSGKLPAGTVTGAWSQAGVSFFGNADSVADTLTVRVGGRALLAGYAQPGAGGLDAAGAVAAVQDAGVFVPAAQAAAVSGVDGIDGSGNGTFTMDVGAAQPIVFQVTGWQVSGGAPDPDVPTITGFSMSPATGATPLVVTATWTASAASGATITSAAVNWGDGATTSPATTGATHTYTGAASRTAVLTVTDSEGRTRTATDTVTVEASDDYESAVTLRYNQANMPTASPWSWPASKGTVPIEWTNPTGGGTTRAADAFGAGKDGLTLENVAAHIDLDTPATFDPSGRGVLIMSLRDLRIDNAGDPLNNGAEQRLAVLGDTVAGVRLEYGIRQAGGTLNWFVKNLDGDLALEPADQPVDSAPGTWPGVEGPLVVALVLHGAASEVRVASGQGVQVVPFDASGIASYNVIDFNPVNGGIKRGLRTHRLVEHGPAGWTSGMVSAAVAAQAADIALTIGS